MNKPTISIWERQSFLSYDVLVIGAGITGLSAAASLKEQDPQLRVAVLEAGILPSGASTKNAGFACFGSVSELVNDLEALGSDRMLELVARRWDGLQKTSQRLGRAVIDLQQHGGYEILLEKNHPSQGRMDEINEILQPLFREAVFKVADHKIKHFGFEKVPHMIENPFEGQLDTGKLMGALWKYCNEMGVKVFTGCKADRIEEKDRLVCVSAGAYTFSAPKLAVCTNAFTSRLLPARHIDIMPGRGVVLAIAPTRPIPFEGTFHYDEGYFYFRNFKDKLIFGGGRNLALKEEATTDPGINPTIRERLVEDLKSIILPGQDFKIEMEWSGIMAFGPSKEPVVQKVSDRIILGARLGGMGVAIGSLVGEEVAELILTG